MIKNKLPKEKHEMTKPEFLSEYGNGLINSYTTKYHLKPFLEKIDMFFHMLNGLEKDVKEIPWDLTEREIILTAISEWRTKMSDFKKEISPENAQRLIG